MNTIKLFSNINARFTNSITSKCKHTPMPHLKYIALQIKNRKRWQFLFLCMQNHFWLNFPMSVLERRWWCIEKDEEREEGDEKYERFPFLMRKPVYSCPAATLWNGIAQYSHNSWQTMKSTNNSLWKWLISLTNSW